MIDTYKYAHEYYQTETPLFQMLPDTGTQGNVHKTFKPFSCLSNWKYFFTQKVIATWNDLPNIVVTAPTVNAFMNRLDAHWKKQDSLYHPHSQ